MDVEVEDRILRVVPHRAPILRIHAVVAVDAAAASVRGREPVGAGALPWSGGAIEGLAQAAAVLLAHGAPPCDGPRRGMLVGVKRFTVHGEPAAGEDVDYHVTLVRRFGPTALVHGRAECCGVRLAEGEITLWADAGGQPK
ncbi:MAG: hypothetical protein ACK5BN_19800 [Planctomycetota bacterium]